MRNDTKITINTHSSYRAVSILMLMFFAYEVFERNFNYHSYSFQSILMRACYTNRLRMQRLPLRFSTFVVSEPVNLAAA